MALSKHAVERLASRYPDEDASFDELDFVYAHGNPLDALMYSSLFCPDFVEIEGMVFWSGVIDREQDVDKVRSALKHYGGDRTETERSINQAEIPYSFMRAMPSTELDDDLWMELCSRIGEMWASRLQQCYPDRMFDVQVEQIDDDDIAVVFSEIRSSPTIDHASS